MSWSFNPFTGNLDLVGGGAVVFEGEVETFADLPETVGDPAVGASFLVRSSTGVWLVNRRQAGIWIRRNNTGVRATDWEYGGDYPVNSVAGKTGNVTLTNSDISGLGSAATANLNAISDADLRIVGSTDATKKVAIEVDSLVSAGTTRTLTVPNGDATIAATPVSRLQQFFSSQTYNVAEGLNVELQLQNSIPSCAIVVVLPRLTTDGARNGDEILISPLSLASGSSYTLQRYVWTGSSYAGSTETITTMEAGQTYRLRLVGGVWTLLVTPNLASPPAIGSTTRNSGAFTTLNATNGTITASAPVLDLSQTWNNAAVTFTGLRFNVTDTASAAASLIADFQLGGVSRAQITKSGITIPTPYSIKSLYSNIDFNNAIDGSHGFVSGQFFVRSTGSFAFASTTYAPDTKDLFLRREAAGTLSQYNLANPQAFRLYNTTDAGLTNYERAKIAWSSNVLQIGTEKAGTGSARALEFQTDGTTRGGFADSGAFYIGTAASYGGTGFQCQPGTGRTGIFHFQCSLQVIASGVTITGGSGATDFVRMEAGRLNFGGTTSAFPALKRSSTTLQVRLADDSAYANIEPLGVTFNGGSSQVTYFSTNILKFETGYTANLATLVNGYETGVIGFGVQDGAHIGFSGSGNSAIQRDAIWFRDAAGIIAQRNGGNAQAYRIYNTVGGTGNVNFERANLRWASNEFIIDVSNGGTGTLRGIKIGSATSSLLGFYGATPVTQRAAIADATDAATTQARLNDLLAAMRSLGLIAT